MYFYFPWKSPFFLPYIYIFKALTCFHPFILLLAFCSCFIKIMLFLFYLRMPVSWNIFLNHFQRYVLLPRDDVLFFPFVVFLTGLLFSICHWARWALSRAAFCHKWGEWFTMDTVLCAHEWEIPFSDLWLKNWFMFIVPSWILSDQQTFTLLR